MNEPECTCTELQRMTVCHDMRNEPHVIGCPRWGMRVASDYDAALDGPPHRFEPSGVYDAGREVCAECGMDRAADEHRPPYGAGSGDDK